MTIYPWRDTCPKCGSPFVQEEIDGECYCPTCRYTWHMAPRRATRRRGYE